MTILLLETLHPDAEALLHAAGAGAVVRAADPNAPAVDCAPITAILTRGRGRIDAALLQRCPALRVIARAGAGLDNLDTAAAAARGIPVVHAPGANTATVAEHTMALLLDLSRGITRTARQVTAGRWEERACYHGDELGGRVLGVIGFGNIGRRVAELASAFGMRVVIAAHGDRAIAAARPVLALPELLAAADAVTLHVPLMPATRRLLGAAELARMRPGALLVNTARGELIDLPALRAALERGALGGFAADVLDREPPAADDPLLHLPNVVLTPHIASLTARTYRSMCVSTVQNVVAVLRGEAPEPRSLFRAR